MCVRFSQVIKTMTLDSFPAVLDDQKSPSTLQHSLHLYIYWRESKVKHLLMTPQKQLFSGKPEFSLPLCEVCLYIFNISIQALKHFTAPSARRSRYTSLWGSARRRPCERPGPCLTSWSRRPWCRCSGRTGTWGSSCGGRSWAPGGGPCTTATVRSAGTGSGRPSYWSKGKKQKKCV